MDKKYITFYKKFILQTKTLSNSGVEITTYYANTCKKFY